MKKWLALSGVVFSLLSLSCEDLVCDGMGTLSVKNTSIGTVQQLHVDGVNYGTVDPGKTKEVDLAPGEHSWQMIGLSGGVGCSSATVIIQECKTSSFSCHGK
jgi:hypothetical protein